MFYLLKSKSFTIKVCTFWLIKHDDLWSNACYVLNVPWNMKNDYFEKICFRQHMIRTVPQPLGKKNITRGDKVGS